MLLRTKCEQSRGRRGTLSGSDYSIYLNIFISCNDQHIAEGRMEVSVESVENSAGPEDVGSVHVSCLENISQISSHKIFNDLIIFCCHANRN